MVREILRVALAALILSGALVSTSAAQWNIPGLSSISTLLDTDGLKSTVQLGYYHNRVRFGGDLENPLTGSVNIPFIFSANPIVSYGGVTLDYVLQGVALGLTCEGHTDVPILGAFRRIGFIGNAWYFIPVGTAQATENWDSSFAAPLTSIGDRASWDAVPDWWRLEALFADSITNEMDLLIGFRWEHFSTKFKNPKDPHVNPQTTNFGGVISTYPVPFHSPQDEAEMGGAGLIPVIGLRVNYGNSSTKLRMSAIGMPFFVKGFGMTQFRTTVGEISTNSVGNTNFRYVADGDLVGGYMVELSLDYTTSLAGIGQVAAFFKWYRFEGDIDFKAPEIAFDIPFQTQFLGQFISPFRGGGGNGNAKVYQNCITVGAMWSMDFRIPSI